MCRTHILKAAVSAAGDALRIYFAAKQCFALCANEKAARHIRSGFSFEICDLWTDQENLWAIQPIRTR